VDVGVAIERAGVFDERVGLQEPAQARVVDPAVHVDDAVLVEVFVAGEAARRDVEHGVGPGRLGHVQPLVPDRAVEVLALPPGVEVHPGQQFAGGGRQRSSAGD